MKNLKLQICFVCIRQFQFFFVFFLFFFFLFFIYLFIYLFCFYFIFIFFLTVSLYSYENLPMHYPEIFSDFENIYIFPCFFFFLCQGGSIEYPQYIIISSFTTQKWAVMGLLYGSHFYRYCFRPCVRPSVRQSVRLHLRRSLFFSAFV